MIREFYDRLTFLSSWRWPKVEGKITTSTLESAYSYQNDASDLSLVVTYEFYVGENGPFTGLSSRRLGFLLGTTLQDAQTGFEEGSPVIVRYRPDDPSVNRLDWRASDC